MGGLFLKLIDGYLASLGVQMSTNWVELKLESHLWNIGSVYICSLNGVRHLEADQSLCNGARMESNRLARKTVSAVQALPQVVRIGPDYIRDIIIIETIKEAFLSNVEDRVRQIWKSWRCVESDV